MQISELTSDKSDNSVAAPDGLISLGGIYSDSGADYHDELNKGSVGVCLPHEISKNIVEASE